MIGRTVIATVAVSLKSYFASLHSFQNRVAELQNDLKENNLNIDVNAYDAINFINQLLDITFAGKNGEILTPVFTENSIRNTIKLADSQKIFLEGIGNVTVDEKFKIYDVTNKNQVVCTKREN